MDDHVVTLNAGSSSVKFALFANESAWPRLVASGQIDGLGATPRFHARVVDGEKYEKKQKLADHEEAIRLILGWIEGMFPDIVIDAIGHRVVHGGLNHSAPVIVDRAILADLRTLTPLAPLHQPHNLAGVEAAHAAFPSVPQVICFDTAFHRGHAFVNDAYALPREYYERGARRFGFHGLSYEYIARRMREIDPVLACGRIIVAHLGAGASLCAMKNGRSVASTMGFSPLDGLPMGTRCGEIDPGLILYLLDHDKMSVADLQHLLYERSGLKGLSGVSSDMLELEASDAPRAREAIDYFVHRIRMEVGALAATLNGLDALVFTGGIGEHAVAIRERVCRDAGWLGIDLDPTANRAGRPRISTAASRVPAWVIPTNEELMIARHTRRLMAGLSPSTASDVDASRTLSEKV
jgi:acetate kinase